MVVTDLTERQLRQSIIQLLHYHYPDPQETSVNSYQTTGDYAEERLPTNDGGAHIFIIKLLQLCISYQF